MSSWGESPSADLADSIAERLASRIEAAPTAPGEAIDWAAAAAGYEREASARGAGTEAAQLLGEASRIHDERLRDPAGALAFLRRAVAADPTWLPALREGRRLAEALGDVPLAVEFLAAEEDLLTAPEERAELALARSRLLAALGRAEASAEALARAVEHAPDLFAVAEELALRAAAAGDRRALADAWLRCAAAAGEPRLEAELLVTAAGLLEDGLGELDRAAQVALRGAELFPADPLVRSAARRHAERLGRHDLLATLLRADAEAAACPEAARAWLALARLLADGLDRPAEAIEALERGRAAAPGDPVLLAELARRREARGEWAEASEACRELAGAHLDRQDAAHLGEAIAAFLRRGEIEEERLGRPEEAIACCRAVLAIEPAHRTALAMLGRLCARTGDHEGLLEAFTAEALAARDPRERALRTYRAAETLEERLGDPERAAALYREALALDPGLLAARAALERLHERAGRWEELAALLAAELADLEADPALAAARLRLSIAQRRAGVLEERLGDLDGARAAWEEVLRLQPAHVPALRALGRIHARAGRPEAHLPILRAEADASPDPAVAAETLLRMAELLERRLGRVDEAEAVYREVLTLAPAHLPALAALARLARQRGDDERLVDVLRDLAATRGAATERAEALTEVGRICEARLRDPVRAAEAYEEALQAAPLHLPAVRALDRLLAGQGRWSELAELRRAAAAHPAERTEALLGLARLCLDRLGDAAVARRALGDAVESAPGQPVPLLHDLRLEAGSPPRRAALRAALADGSPPRLAAAWLVAAASDVPPGPERAAHLSRAAALDPASTLLAPWLDRLAAGGDPRLAAEQAEARRAAAATAGERARWGAIAAEGWARAGDDGRASAAAGEALRDQPGFLPALRAARAVEARRGAWGEVRASLLAEAQLLRDLHGVTAALLEAGAIGERLGDRDGAARDYRAAAERDPLDPVPPARLEALLAEGAAELVAVREARARAERDPARAAEAWLSVARAALGTAGGAELALAALERSLAARPGPAARSLRARLLAEAGRHLEAAAEHEAAAAEVEPGARVPHLLAAAALCQERLSDARRAQRLLEAALALQPEDREALARLAQLQAGTGELAGATDTLRRLLALPGLAPAEAAAHHLALARVDARTGDASTALAHVARALELAPGQPAALQLLVDLERQRGDPRAMAAALEQLAAVSAEPRVRAEARIEAARLHGGSLRQRPQAVELLRAALFDAPDHREARQLLAGALEEPAPGQAVEEHRRLLAADPLAVESWAALFRLFERQRAHDRAFVAASVLRLLGAPPPGAAAERILLEGDRQTLAAPPAVSEEDLALLCHPDDRGPLADLVAAAGDAMADAVRGGPFSPGEPARSDRPFRRVLGELCRALGVEEWDLFPTSPGRLVVEPGERPAVLAGTDLARRTTTREQRFLLGRAVARLRRRSTVAETLGPELLGEVVAAAVRLAVPGWSGTGRPSEDLVRRLGRALPRRQRRAAEAAARALAELPAPPDLPRWRAAAAATADRFGLVLCGDVPTALTLLLFGPGSTLAGPEAVRSAVAGSAPARALLAFAAAEPHFALRQRLRVAVA